jgi:hypothetical protein
VTQVVEVAETGGGDEVLISHQEIASELTAPAVSAAKGAAADIGSALERTGDIVELDVVDSEAMADLMLESMSRRPSTNDAIGEATGVASLLTTVVLYIEN